MDQITLEIIGLLDHVGDIFPPVDAISFHYGKSPAIIIHGRMTPALAALASDVGCVSGDWQDLPSGRMRIHTADRISFTMSIFEQE